MSGHRMSMQEWLLEIDQVYRDNYAALLKHSPNGLNHVQPVLRWQFNSAKRRAFKAGLLDEEGRRR